MAGHLIVLLPVAAVWVAAAVVADGLPRLDRARALRRRTGWLSALTLHRPGADRRACCSWACRARATRWSTGPPPASALAAAPALMVAVCTVRRVRRLRAGAGAFARAPETPAPHGLRAAGAHPLIGLPLQVTALATVPAVVSAAGAGPPRRTGRDRPRDHRGRARRRRDRGTPRAAAQPARRAGDAGGRRLTASGSRPARIAARGSPGSPRTSGPASRAAARSPSGAAPSAARAAADGPPGTRRSPAASRPAGTTAR